MVNYRDLQITPESEREIGETVRLGQLSTATEPFALRDVTFHSGCTYHRASGNTTDDMHKVIAVFYMDSDMRPRMPNERTKVDAEWLCAGIKPGEIIDTPLTPIIYQR